MSTEPPDDRPPLDVRRPFTRAAGLRVGLGRRLLSDEFQQVMHGVYLSSSIEVTAVHRAAAALITYGPRAWASHASAARVLGVPIPTLPGEHVTVLDRKRRHRRTGVVCHSAAGGLIVTVEDVRVSAPAQLFVELASMLALVDLVVVGDHLVRRSLITRVDLRKHCAEASGPGSAQARAAVAFVREGVDSPMETRLRMLIVLAGLPEPEVNPVVTTGGLTRRYDLCWRKARLVVEYDGRHHIEREEQWESDLSRREDIEDDGWRVLIVTAKGVYRTPDETLAKIHRLLLERGEAGVPRRLATRWQPHFPIRGDYNATMAAK